MPRSPAVPRWSRNSISGRSRAARAPAGRAAERGPLRTAHKMADAPRAPGTRCWRRRLLRGTRCPQTSASPAAASAGAASRRHMSNSSGSSRPALCPGGLLPSQSPQKTWLLGGTFRSPGRAEKRKVVPSLSLLSLPRSPLHLVH